MSYGDNTQQNTIQTVDETPTVIMSIDYSTGQLVSDLTSRVIAQDTNTGTSASISHVASFKNVGGVVTQVGTTAYGGSFEDSSWSADWSISGTSVNLTVTGAAGVTINWSASAAYGVQQ